MTGSKPIARRRDRSRDGRSGGSRPRGAANDQPCRLSATSSGICTPLTGNRDALRLAGLTAGHHLRRRCARHPASGIRLARFSAFFATPLPACAGVLSAADAFSKARWNCPAGACRTRPPPSCGVARARQGGRRQVRVAHPALRDASERTAGCALTGCAPSGFATAWDGERKAPQAKGRHWTGGLAQLNVKIDADHSADPVVSSLSPFDGAAQASPSR